MEEQKLSDRMLHKQSIDKAVTLKRSIHNQVMLIEHHVSNLKKMENIVKSAVTLELNGDGKPKWASDTKIANEAKRRISIPQNEGYHSLIKIIKDHKAQLVDTEIDLYQEENYVKYYHKWG